MRIGSYCKVVLSVCLLISVGGLRAQEASQRAESKEYSRSEAMIPMRDGVKLHVVILRPVGSESTGEPLPFLMERTPYGTDNNTSKTVNTGKPELAASGYIFVFGDIRGRYESGGTVCDEPPDCCAYDEERCGRDDGYAGHDRLAAEERSEQ